MNLHPEGEKDISSLIEGERINGVLPLPKGVLRVLRNAGLALSLALTAPHAADLINSFLQPNHKDPIPIARGDSRGDSGESYKISQDPQLTTALEDQILRLSSNQPYIDTTPVKPMDCPYPSVDHGLAPETNHPEVDLSRVDIYGLVVGFSDQEEALDRVANSTYYYREGLRRQLDLATSYINRFLNIKFSTKVLDGYFVYPKTYGELKKLGAGGEGLSHVTLMIANERMPRQQYNKLAGTPHTIYSMMYVTNPNISLKELASAVGIIAGKDGAMGRITIPWYFIDPDYTNRKDGWSGQVFSHELLHGLGIRHNPNNPRSVMYPYPTVPFNEAIIDKTDLSELRCTFKSLVPISSR